MRNNFKTINVRKANLVRVKHNPICRASGHTGGEFAQLYAPWALMIAQRGAEPLNLTKNAEHDLPGIFVNLFFHPPVP